MISAWEKSSLIRLNSLNITCESRTESNRIQTGRHIHNIKKRDKNS